MRTLKNLVNLCALVIGHLFPRTRKKIVFGAWAGASFSDNPKYLFLHLSRHPEFRIVWMGNRSVRSTLPELPRNASFAVRHSPLGFWHALTAQTWIYSHSPVDISLFAIWGRATFVNTCHGVAIKHVGAMRPSVEVDKPGTVGRLLQKRAHLGMPSARQSRNTLAAYPFMFLEPTLPFGSPTIDWILAHKDDATLRKTLRTRIADAFGLPAEKKWIVYAPTFRRLSENNFSFRDISPRGQASLESVLRATGSVIVEKLHPDRIRRVKQGESGFVFSLSGMSAETLDPQELWLAADAVISDYSSCVVPFFLQGKPVIHFVYDLESYENEDTGLVAPLEDIRFGAIAKDFHALTASLADLDSARDDCGPLAHELIEWEDGRSCEKYLAFLREKTEKGKPPPPTEVTP